MTYKDLLLDPRWQRKRLEVLEREDFKCQECGSKEKTLHVHHTFYGKGRKPWEYDAASLRSLCADCHESVTTLTASLHEAIGSLSETDMRSILGFVNALRWCVGQLPDGIPAPSDSEVRGVLRAFAVRGEDVHSCVGAMATIDGGVIAPDMIGHIVEIARNQRALVLAGLTAEHRAEAKQQPADIPTIAGGL